MKACARSLGEATACSPGREPWGKWHHSCAQPRRGDGKVYAASRDGVITVFEGADRLHVLARNDFGESISATLALVDSQLYIRTDRALYAFGQ